MVDTGDRVIFVDHTVACEFEPASHPSSAAVELQGFLSSFLICIALLKSMISKVPSRFQIYKFNASLFCICSFHEEWEFSELEQ